MMKKMGLLAGVLSLTMVSNAAAAEEVPSRVGGHLGLAVPIVTIADPVRSIGADYTILGLVTGLNLKLNQRWSIDFETVAYSNFWGGGNISSIVIDPGVLYSFDFATVGLRTAVHVTQTQNWGLIPIIVKSFPLGELPIKAYIELDLPVFFNETGAALTVQPQGGIAF
ncbi:MAG TPA: hypothetical protein VLC09_17260 [Polyangiaceae bacterium]|nr:hypothetical protein [Polyangiaceae bacterium]